MRFGSGTSLYPDNEGTVELLIDGSAAQFYLMGVPRGECKMTKLIGLKAFN